MEERPRLQTSTEIHLHCEVCSQTSVVWVPMQCAPYRIVDCPRCGDTYIVSLDAAHYAPRRSLEPVAGRRGTPAQEPLRAGASRRPENQTGPIENRARQGSEQNA
jgi:hypothetical protein